MVQHPPRSVAILRAPPRADGLGPAALVAVPRRWGRKDAWSRGKRLPNPTTSWAEFHELRKQRCCCADEKTTQSLNHITRSSDAIRIVAGNPDEERDKENCPEDDHHVDEKAWLHRIDLVHSSDALPRILRIRGA